MKAIFFQRFDLAVHAEPWELKRPWCANSGKSGAWELNQLKLISDRILSDFENLVMDRSWPKVIKKLIKNRSFSTWNFFWNLRFPTILWHRFLRSNLRKRIRRLAKSSSIMYIDNDQGPSHYTLNGFFFPKRIRSQT